MFTCNQSTLAPVTHSCQPAFFNQTDSKKMCCCQEIFSLEFVLETRQVNTRRLTNPGLTMGHRLRRRPSQLGSSTSSHVTPQPRVMLQLKTKIV